MKRIGRLTTGIMIMGCLALAFTKPAKAPGNPEGHETIPEKYFIAPDFFTKYKLEAAVRSSPRIHDWTSMDPDNKYAVVNDIRWEFDKPEQALDYHKKNLVQNSQKGVELHPKLTIPGATELHIYKESTTIENFNKDLNINTMEYGYLFTIDNVAIKVWVKVNGNITVEEASVFAKEAAKTVQEALKK